MTPHLWRRFQLLAGGTVLVLLVARLGTGPFTAGLRALDAWSLLAAAAVTVPTTFCVAWRWRLVARGLGLDLRLRTAVVASYRSQLVNSTLPGGVVGDVHRGVRHGRDVGATGSALRVVGWERLAGQAVQVALAVPVLLMFPSPVRSSLTHVQLLAVVVLVVVTLLVTALVPVVRSDLRALLASGAAPGVVLLSALAVAGHVTVFAVAARTAGVTVGPDRLLPLALLVLLAMAVPFNVAGWGPREGVAAWAFGAAGLGASAGIETAVVYGVLVLVASLPGAAVLVVESVRRRSESGAEPELEEVAHG
jgi:uncharacterized membrane protein YbhN (UPF0104 family)